MVERDARHVPRDWAWDVVERRRSRRRSRPASRSPRSRRTSARAGSGFDFEQAFGKPTKVVNDAVMQALGSYDGGRMLFLGLGTGLGSALIIDGVVEPLELAHLRFEKATFEDYVGERALERLRQEEVAQARRRGRRGQLASGDASRTTSCSAAAASRSSTSCPRTRAGATTSLPSSAASGSETRLDAGDDRGTELSG